MQRRTRTLAFAAGRYVFPGGAVEPEDITAQVPFADQPPRQPPFAVGGDIVLDRPAPADAMALYRGLVVAAVRETLEEAGVLLAECEDGPVSASAAQRVREGVLAGAQLGSALQRIGGRLRYGNVVALAHWMTPAVEVRRYDTRFFAAALPPGQQARSASGESDSADWVRPGEMLQRAADGDVVMLPPTTAALQALRQQRRASDVLSAGHRPRLRPVLPHPVRRDDGIEWRLVDGYTGREWGSP